MDFKFLCFKKRSKKTDLVLALKNSNLTTISTTLLNFTKMRLTKDWKDLVQTYNLEDERG